VTFEVLNAASMKMTVFWDTVSCFLVEIDRCFIGAYYLHHHGGEGCLLGLAPCSLVEVYRRFRGAYIIRVALMEAATSANVGKLLPDYTAQ
jgi:hypothetical protein